jgi:hypothetical protein
MRTDLNTHEKPDTSLRAAWSRQPKPDRSGASPVLVSVTGFWDVTPGRQVASYHRSGGSNTLLPSSGCKAPYKLSVKLSDFTVWRHTWRKNWVNCAVLTRNSAGLRTVRSSRLSHTHTTAQITQGIPQFPQYTCRHHDVTRARRRTELAKKKTDKPDGKPVLCQRTFSSGFRTVFLHS